MVSIIIPGRRSGLRLGTSDNPITGGGGGGPDFSSAQIGDYIGGGVYAGIKTIGSTAYYIIGAVLADEAPSLAHKTTRTETPGTGSYDDGLANTESMELAGIADHPAAEYCVNYGAGGYSDWYYPAANELNLLYDNLVVSGHPEFPEESDNRSSSTTTSADFCRGQRFSVDRIDSLYKDNGYKVRPIRRVPV